MRPYSKLCQCAQPLWPLAAKYWKNNGCKHGSGDIAPTFPYQRHDRSWHTTVYLGCSCCLTTGILLQYPTSAPPPPPPPPPPPCRRNGPLLPPRRNGPPPPPQVHVGSQAHMLRYFKNLMMYLPGFMLPDHRYSAPVSHLPPPPPHVEETVHSFPLDETAHPRPRMCMWGHKHTCCGILKI